VDKYGIWRRRRRSKIGEQSGDYDGFELCTDGPQGYGTISVRIAPPSLFIKDILTGK